MTGKMIVLLDMDCFYVQVEERDNPHIKGKPAAVVQYNSWKGGGIIAVNYEARAFGVKRNMRGDEAKAKCPSIHLVQVPVQRGKADLTKYRNAGKEVVTVLCEFSDCVERASIDEAYIDFTKVINEKVNVSPEPASIEDLPSTWVVGYEEKTDDALPESARQDGLSLWLSGLDDENMETVDSPTPDLETIKLSLAALVCEEMRRKVLEVTGFKCSAGISNNKMLSKLACGLHKPNQQTVLPMASVPDLWAQLPIGKIRNLGGKLGDSLTTDLGCNTMGDLSKLSLAQLRNKHDEKTAHWLHSLGQGIDPDPVTSRQLAKSIGCGKNFNGKEILNTREKVNAWMTTLAEELSERLEQDRESNNRNARTLTAHVRQDSEEKPASTRSCPLPSYHRDAIARAALALIACTNSAASKEEKWQPPIRNISLSAGKFEDLSSNGTTKIKDIFRKVDASVAFRNDSPRQSHSAQGQQGRKSDGKDFEARPSTPKTKASATDAKKSFFLQFLTKKNQENVNPNAIEESDSGKGCDSDEPNGRGDADKAGVKVDVDSEDSVYEVSTDEDEASCDREEELFVDSSPVLRSKRKAAFGTPKPPYVVPVLEKDSAKGNEGRQTPPPSSSFFLSVCSSSKRKSPQTEEGSDFVTVKELFPDLDNVDPSLLEMLPTPLRDKVKSAVVRHRRERKGRREEDAVSTSTPIPSQDETPTPILSEDDIVSMATGFRDQELLPEVKLCKECNRKIPTQSFTEHSDYHFAMELRKQQMTETMAGGSKKKLSPNSSKSLPKCKRSKKTDPSAASTQKIDKYFKKLKT